ncbi:MAG: chondroitinase-B domain-containing protein [Opitutaceae bacterium]|nr:chondroitinase-B domain-containing protein [Opitutaceae bacterium]
MSRHFCPIFALCMPLALTAAEVQVSDPDTLLAALKTANPGDEIVLAKGTYRDVALRWSRDGTADKPIILRAETTGQVFLEGESYLRLGGDHLVVEGLVFRNGYAPKGGVVEFMVDDGNIANHSRVTACAIDHYNKPDRFKSDHWVVLQGRENRFDHNYVAGKLNEGTTVIVELNLEQHRQNKHLIDHNVFGYRPRLGSNGGETIRIGVSAFCQYSSETRVENNWFERCSGEVEIVSVKSSDNVIRGNVFLECEGVVALRHGDRNRVEGNYFLGNNKPFTGGVRVVNESHVIRDNHFQELTGPRFFGTLPIMNGVPNSLPNRYMPVKNVTIENNRFFNCGSLVIGEGRDNERTVSPTGCRVAGNVFWNDTGVPPVSAVSDASGVHFENNFAEIAGRPHEAEGFAPFNETVEKPGLLYQTSTYTPSLPITRGACMPAYPPLPEYRERVIEGRRLQVSPGADSLLAAVAASRPGDTLELQPGASYALSRALAIRHPLTLATPAGTEGRALLHNPANKGGAPLLRLENGGSLSARGLRFDGFSENGVADAAITTDSAKPMIDRFSVIVEDCDFVNFDSGGCSAFVMTKGTYADSVSFKNCRFENISGTALSLRAEWEDKGKYNAEYVTVENCLFVNIMGACLDLYRGGNDESTTGPFLSVNRCTFVNCTNVELGSVLRLIGVQVADVRNNVFVESGMSGRSVRMEDHRWCQMLVSHSNFDTSGRVESYYEDRKGPGLTFLPVQFVNRAEGNFRLEPGSPLLKLGSDGQGLGWR